MGKRRKKSFLKGLAISVVAVAGVVMVLLGTLSLDWLSNNESHFFRKFKIEPIFVEIWCGRCRIC